MFREGRQWSQDTLSALTKLSLRTIQRVESGEPSSAETRRALALAFELEDIDIFNRPFKVPDPKQIEAEMEKFKRENVTLEAHPVRTGQELVQLFESAQMDYSNPNIVLTGAAAEAYAGLVDYLRDHRDCADLMIQTEKLVAYDDIQNYLDALHKAGFSICCARRDTKLVGRDWKDKTPWPVSILYLIVCPKGSEAKMVFAPRQVRLALPERNPFPISRMPW
jgi:transcriptional regulator with XRE-family HTH domain